MRLGFTAIGLLILVPFLGAPDLTAQKGSRRTAVAIAGDAFHINGQPTYEGRTWKGHTIEGLLLNSRMVQGIFDDLNPETRGKLGLPRHRSRGTPSATPASSSPPCPSGGDTACWPSRINLQGGSPQGYSKDQPWHNSAFTADGALRPEYLARLAAHPRPRRRAGHGRRSSASSTSARTSACEDEAAVIAATDGATTGCSTGATATC